MNTILFTNDDGYESIALHDFYQYVSTKHFPDAKKILMAPHEDKSGISHAITIGAPLIFRERETNMFEVEGYPADCTMACYSVLENPDIVLSGPNFGSNLGQDILYSGTVAAAREAALRNVPALAFSFANDKGTLNHINYDAFHAFLDKWLLALIKLAMHNKGSIVNVNICLPIELSLVEGTLGYRYYYNYHLYEKGMDHRGEYCAAIPKEGLDESKDIEEGSDVYFIRQGQNVFNVFSAWPKLKVSQTDVLLSYLEG